MNATPAASRRARRRPARAAGAWTLPAAMAAVVSDIVRVRAVDIHAIDLAAFLIGFAQILTVVYLGSHYQTMVALLAIILTLILKPSGLFGQQKELEERV